MKSALSAVAKLQKLLSCHELGRSLSTSIYHYPVLLLLLLLLAIVFTVLCGLGEQVVLYLRIIVTATVNGVDFIYPVFKRFEGYTVTQSVCCC